MNKLETKCEICDGEGRLKKKNSYYFPCDNCNAVGFLPTEEGKQLLDFIERHLSIAYLAERIYSLEIKTSERDPMEE